MNNKKMIINLVILFVISSGTLFAQPAGSSGQLVSEATAKEHAKQPVKYCSNYFPVVDCVSKCKCEESSGKYYTTMTCTNGVVRKTEVHSCDKSAVNNHTFNYIHYASDYTSNVSGAGCGSCGPSNPNVVDVPNFGLQRYHRSRDIGEITSMGPGVSNNFDLKLHFSEYTNGVGSVNMAHLFDPAIMGSVAYMDGPFPGPHPFNLTDVQDGVYPCYRNNATDSLSLYTGTINALFSTTDLSLATFAIVKSWEGRKFYFEIIDVDGDLHGRVRRFENRNGYKAEVNYVYAAGTLGGNPDDALWKISDVVDGNNRTATFTYKSTQVGSMWVISSVTCPNSQVINYGYNAVELNQITFPNGDVSTFTSSFDIDSNCIKVVYSDAAASGTHRTKDVYLSTNYTMIPDFEEDVYPTAASLVRMVVNGNGEVTYLNLISPVGGVKVYVYEGKGSLKSCDFEEVRSAKDFDIPLVGLNGYDNLSFTPEANRERTYFDFSNGARNLYYDMPHTYKSKTDVTTTLIYNNASRVTKRTFSDSKTSEITRNAFQQPTRIKDRENRVRRFEYNSLGYITKREEGILFNGTIDVNQSEYASYTWEYYPASHANEELLRYAFDANGNRTEFIYSADQLLIEVKEPDDAGSGYHTKSSFTYNTEKELATMTDAVGRVTQQSYDTRNRVVKNIYHDTSSEIVTYGSGADVNLVVLSKDRDGATSKNEYDASGRGTKNISAYSRQDVNGLNEVVSSTQVQSISEPQYLDGTNEIISFKMNGDKTDYVLDYRYRIIESIKYPKVGTVLTEKTKYINNLLFSQTDVYGRTSFNQYRDSDKRLIRSIQGTTSAFTLTSFTDVFNQTRDLTNNADYLITNYTLNFAGDTTEVIDPRGIKHTTAYDSRVRVTSSVEASGTAVAATTSYVLDSNSNLTQTTNPRGFITETAYTRRNKTQSIKVAKGTTEEADMSFTYFNDGRANSVTDFRGNSSSSVWHSCCGRIQAQIDEAGHGTVINNTFADDKSHIIIVEAVTSHSANYHDTINLKTINEVTTRYDARHRPIFSTTWLVPRDNIDPNKVPIAGGPETGDPDVEISSVIQGLTTKYEYFDEAVNTLGVVVDTRLTDIYAKLVADGVTLGANSQGSSMIITNPEGELSVSINDGVGRSVITGIIDKTTFLAITWDTIIYDVYDATKDLLITESKDALDHSNKSLSDGAGRTHETIDALGKISKFEFDANSSRVKSRNANNIGMDCLFDARNRDYSCTDTQGDTTLRTFDANNNVTLFTDAKGNTVASVFDARDRMTQVTDRLNGVTKYTFDDNNNNITIEDAETKITEYTYDVRNLVIETEYPDHVASTSPGDVGYGIVTCTYDAGKRRDTCTDQLGDKITYIFDMANRVEERQYRLLGAGSDESIDLFTYDLASRRTFATKGRYGHTVGHLFDEAGRVTDENLVVNSKTYTTSYVYDVANRQTSCTYPDGSVLTKTYSDRNELLNQKLDGVDVSTCVYDDGFREITHTAGNGLVTNYAFARNDDFVTGITVTGKVDLSFTYTYDLNKNVTAETRTGVLSGTSFTATYDDGDRLSAWTRTNGTDTQTWGLSLVGDWITTTINGVAESRTYNDAHELTARGASSLTYDAKGNLKTQGTQTNTWDIDSHLKTLVDTATTITANYTYGPDGRRLTKEVNGTTTVFTYSGQQVLVEYDGASDPTIDDPERKFVYGTYIDKPLMVMDHTGGSPFKYYYHQNRQYNVIGLTNDAGDIVELRTYDAYGK